MFEQCFLIWGGEEWKQTCGNRLVSEVSDREWVLERRLREPHCNGRVIVWEEGVCLNGHCNTNVSLSWLRSFGVSARWLGFSECAFYIL